MSEAPSPAAVAELFRNVFLSEESGALEVRSEGKVYLIFFDRGMVTGGRGGSPEGNGEASKAEDTARVVEQAFSCMPEQIGFRGGPPPPGDSQADILRTVELFLVGVRAMSGFEEIREALVALERRLVIRPNPAVPLERLTLRPIHGFVLSRLSGNLSFNEITSTVGPQDESETSRFLFALLLLGSIALDPPIAPGLLCTDPLLVDHRRDFAREESETAFIRETYSHVMAQSPYQVLGVLETASHEEMRKAYDERRRALAADRFHVRVRERLRSELTIIEARLAEVYLALQAGVSGRPGFVMPIGDETLDFDALSLRREVTKTEVAASIDEQEKLAESYYHKAKKYFTQADFYNCIQYCTQAIRQSDQNPRYYLLLGEAQSRNPDRRWQKMAEQSFLQAVKLDPWNAGYLVTLGQFYKRQGLNVRARRQFERALELQPGHPKAREELETLA